MRELSYLDVSADVLWRRFETLSNGEQTKVLLAALFLNENHFLLIDEPTNHLDTNAREKAAAYLKKKKGFILVSHDRRFLDGCVDHILSLNRTTIEVQSGNFSSWMENFQRQQKFETAQNERLKKDIGRLQRAAQRTSVWSDQIEASKYGNGPVDRGYLGHKAAKMRKRSKTIEARQQQAIEQKAALLKNAETVDTLKIHPLTYHSDLLVSFSDVSVIYDNTKVCEPVFFEIHQGERVVIDGKNGSGKSSLLKLLLNYPIEHTGTAAIGSGLIISYVPQDTSHLNGNLSNLQRKIILMKVCSRRYLERWILNECSLEKNMEDFSGGQKKKVLIAKSLCEQAHLYVWDEPLNFIDVYSRMQIEHLIKQFAPTMLLVEHDIAFREAIATKVVKL